MLKVLDSASFSQAIWDKSTELRLVHCGKFQATSHYTLGPRVIDDHLVYIIHEGGFDARVSGEYISLNTQSLYWVPPGVHYQFSLKNPAPTTVYTWCRFNIRQGDEILRFEDDFLKLEADLRAVRASDELLPQNSLVTDHWDNIRFKSLVTNLYCYFQDAGTEEQKSIGLLPNQRQAILDYIFSHISERYTIKDLAQHVKMNPIYMSAQFKRSFGINPQTYIKEARIKKSANLLYDQDLRIGEVAEMLGYDNIYLFSRQFKEVMGASPKQWLRKQQVKT